MRLKSNSTEQKLRGAYYTPFELAQGMIKLVDIKPAADVLEPSCGDGVFLDALRNADLLSDIHSIDVVEIEPGEAEKVSMRYVGYDNIHVFCNDFFEFYEHILNDKKYDLILGNPPYIRYQYLQESQRELLADILESHGMKANKLINAWVAFLVAGVQLLADEGEILFVIPAEILQVAYAEDLRLYLSKNLSSITMITFEELVFPDIEQEIVVFIGKKGDDLEGIRIIEMHNLDDIENLDLDRFRFQELQHVREKWTKYFVSSDELSLIQKVREDGRFAKFSEYGLINVGITTGNNNYFSVSDKTSKGYGLDSITLPLIGRSSHAHGIYFTEEDWISNRKAGKKARLVCFPETDYIDYPEPHKKYIAEGESAGENDGYKCSIRDRWYIIPSVWVPDAFFLRRNNFYPKFVLNACGAVSTDTMHRMKFNDGVDPENVLLAYYNSITFAFTEICGRSYGGGVLEILPGEMGNIMLPKITSIDASLKKDLLMKIDGIVRADDDIEKALDIVDQAVLIDLLDVDPDWCNKCRLIWKKMQRRRLGRG